MRFSSGNYSCPSSLSSKIPFHSASLIQMPSSRVWSGCESPCLQLLHTFESLLQTHIKTSHLEWREQSFSVVSKAKKASASATKPLNILAAKVQTRRQVCEVVFWSMERLWHFSINLSHTLSPFLKLFLMSHQFWMTASSLAFTFHTCSAWKRTNYCSSTLFSCWRIT